MKKNEDEIIFEAVERTEEIKERKKVKILRDNKGQFSIKVPKQYAEDMQINNEKDIWSFILVNDGQSYKLEGELIKND